MQDSHVVTVHSTTERPQQKLHIYQSSITTQHFRTLHDMPLVLLL